MQEQMNQPEPFVVTPPESLRPAPAAGERRLGPYALVREAGRGGMAQVYEAVDTRMGRTVAVKVLASSPHLLPAQRDALIARLRREAQALGSLSHPNVVAIFDVGEQDGLHYLVMEYLDGLTLRQRLDNSGPLTPAEAESVLSQVALGLDAVHARGVLHRDIKPSNVMRLPDGHVKLMDFGVARQADDTTMTQAGMMVGSPAYLAPELIAGDKGVPATDIWALGVLLHEMLAGSSPFTGDNIPAVLYQIAHGEPAPLPNVSPAVANVLKRALEKDPAKRFPTARALADAFRAAALPAAPAPSPSRRARAYTPATVKSEESTIPVGDSIAATAVHPAARRRPGDARAKPGRRVPSAVIGLIALLCLGAAGLFAASRLRSAHTAPRLSEQTAKIVPSASTARNKAVPSPPGPKTSAKKAALPVVASVPAPQRRRPAPSRVIVAERPRREASRRSSVSEAAAPRSRPRRTLQQVPPTRTIQRNEPERIAEANRTPIAPAAPARRSARRKGVRRSAPPTPARTRVAAATRTDEDRRISTGRQNDDAKNDPIPASGNSQAELRGHLAGWLQATNARDINGQMRFYPDRVDNFYRTRRASKNSVQAEKRRIFGAASSVAMSASDPKITLARDGKTATMRFRKRYDIAGGRVPRRGEVLQELRWRRTDDGKWQIVSERDLRVLRRR